MKQIAITSVLAVVLLCSCHRGGASEGAGQQEQAQPTGITAEMAYEGVNNYCHKEYNWGVADSVIMYVRMDEETATEYTVVFRSYTSAEVYFHVDKKTGKTRMVEHVPSLGVESESGTIDLMEYVDASRSGK